MENSSNEYHISFFKPTTPQAKANRNMVLWFVIIWAIAIFGFHFLMRAIEKPTPEPILAEFEEVWTNVEKGDASQAELQQFGRSTLQVLCKITIDPDDKKVLNNALSWSIHQLTTDTLRDAIIAEVVSFEKTRAEITDIKDKAYVEARNKFSTRLGSILNLPLRDVRSKILPLEVMSENMTSFTEENASKLPAVMKKYLIHNQSFLTDTKFLGFPFHYFYSAVFLLILFVGLCWFYCLKTDQLNAKFGIVE